MLLQNGCVLLRKVATSSIRNFPNCWNCVARIPGGNHFHFFKRSFTSRSFQTNVFSSVSVKFNRHGQKFAILTNCARFRSTNVKSPDGNWKDRLWYSLAVAIFMTGSTIFLKLEKNPKEPTKEHKSLKSPNKDSKETETEVNLEPNVNSMAEGGLKDEFKVLNDPIHGHIEIHPLCVKIMDTPQFQRLRYLKQLGGAYFVYPGASHNRFEHSLGVCHLAGQFVTSLKDRQPDLKISESDILCVKIAGLCHDLGHGPFSHLFDKFFLPAIGKKHIKHEDLSLKMFDYLVDDNNLSPEFTKYGLTETDKLFIKELIKGRENDQSVDWKAIKRPQEKGFLFDIVANKRCGIDVDKWDYFARDCHMLGINNNFDHARCMMYARVFNVNGHSQIGFRDKEVGDLYEMFHTRITLHRRAYQHAVTKIIERMITDALVETCTELKLTMAEPKSTENQPDANDKKGKPETNRTALNIFRADGGIDMEAYTKLTDSIFEEILWSTSKLEKASGILKKILKRELYKCVRQKCLPPKHIAINKEENEIKDDLVEILKEFGSPLKKEDIIIDKVYLNYGKGDENPMDHVFFYKKENKKDTNKIQKHEVSNMLPETFSEQLIRCYCKERDKERIEEAEKAFDEWWKKTSDESV